MSLGFKRLSRVLCVVILIPVVWLKQQFTELRFSLFISVIDSVSWLCSLKNHKMTLDRFQPFTGHEGP